MNEPQNKPIQTVSKLTKSNRIKRNKAVALQIMIVSAFLVLLFLIGLLFPLRPSVSEREKRELTKFPSFSIAAIMDGSYFTQLELWYADTFPMREWLMSLDRGFDSLFGFGEEQYIGDKVVGDEIPEVDTDSGDFDWMTLPPGSTGSQSAPPVTETPSTGSPSTGDDPLHPTTQPPNAGGDDPDVPSEKHGSVYLMGDTAYELYGFNRSATDRYIDMVNSLADDLKGSASVYSVIAPLSYAINLSESTQESMGASNQNDALLYIYSEMNDQVKKVYAYNNLMAHRDEYLYYRTDHHWTALGAYYTYEMFCAQKGIAPTPLSAYQTRTYDGFLGSLFDICGSPSAMAEHPDQVIAYQPLSTNRMTCYQKNGSVLEWNIITNVDSWSASSKYNTFIGGDNPYSEIHNPNKQDGSSCVVVKNSYGCAFVPFLVDHYEYVYVVDFRYYDKWSESYNNGLTFGELVEQKNIDDVVIVTNITATATHTLLDSMEAMFEK